MTTTGSQINDRARAKRDDRDKRVEAVLVGRALTLDEVHKALRDPDGNDEVSADTIRKVLIELELEGRVDRAIAKPKYARTGIHVWFLPGLDPLVRAGVIAAIEARPGAFNRGPRGY